MLHLSAKHALSNGEGSRGVPRDAVENQAQPPKRKGRQVKRSNFLGDLGGKILIRGFSTDFLAGYLSGQVPINLLSTPRFTPSARLALNLGWQGPPPKAAGRAFPAS
jgi:hypothetical protein